VEPRIQRHTEVDLTVALDGITPASQLPPPPGKDIEGVFAQLRDEASRRLSIDGAERDFEKGMAHYRAGESEAAMSDLESAARAPRFRFDAAVAIARIFRERGQSQQAIEWLEQAADAPARTAGDGHRVLLQLADQLESVGEVARALAVCLELRAEAGDYQDVVARVDRLAKVQARG
jgi:lipopolysaccharide biosynthesis regulator YciM